MFLLAKRQPTQVQEALPKTLDELFAELAKYGRLSLYQHDDGKWSAKLEIPTTNPAITAEIRSGFNHGTPHEALKELLKKTQAPATEEK